MKDVFGRAYKLDMSTDYSVKVKTFAEGLVKIKDEQILCSYANSKENFNCKTIICSNEMIARIDG